MKLFGEAWAPTHATLIFAVPERFENPMKMGSIGVGFNFAAGVQTKIELRGRSSDDLVYWNGNLIDGKVSITAADIFRERQNSDDSYLISHSSQIPIGCGLSTSGAGALGVVYALDDLYDSNIGISSLNDMAHQADVTNNTGLGSVVGQTSGGIEIRLTQGSPSTAKTKIIHNSADIVILIKGPLSTPDVLVSESMMKKVTQTGLKLTQNLNSVKGNWVTEFIKIGHQFMLKCGLATTRIISAVEDLKSIGEGNVTMSMIGESLIVNPISPIRLEKWANDNQWIIVKTKITNELPKIVINP